MGFLQLALPLNHLTRKGVLFEWSQECEQGFRNLKVKLTTPLVFVISDPEAPFEVYTNASKKGLGCVLMQRSQVVAYASRQL